MTASAGKDPLIGLLEKAARDSSDLPPVSQWQPELTGDLDMRIARDGSWYYLGSKIRRPALVRLFSRILRREGDAFFMVTPVEKYRIQVEDAPFTAVLLDVIDDDGVRKLAFTTNVDSTVIAGDGHDIRVETDPQTREPSPYLHVRDGLEALISRNVFYQLVEIADEVQVGDERYLQVSSAGRDYRIGRL